MQHNAPVPCLASFSIPSTLFLKYCVCFVEDSSGEAVGAVLKSTAPLEGSGSADEFTTYFDQKIPIPEDETVSVAGRVSLIQKQRLDSLGGMQRIALTALKVNSFSPKSEGCPQFFIWKGNVAHLLEFLQHIGLRLCAEIAFGRFPFSKGFEESLSS